MDEYFMLADRVEREDIPIQDYSHSCFFITRSFLFREATMIKKEKRVPSIKAQKIKNPSSENQTKLKFSD